MEENVKECPICCDALQQNDKNVTTVCSHDFHEECLLSYVKYNLDKSSIPCPVCRREIFACRFEEMRPSTTNTVDNQITFAPAPSAFCCDASALMLSLAFFLILILFIVYIVSS